VQVVAREKEPRTSDIASLTLATFLRRIFRDKEKREKVMKFFFWQVKMLGKILVPGNPRLLQ
jgi:hypothetical protein